MRHRHLFALILGISMVDVSATVSPASIAEIKRAINATQRETGRSIHESVKYAAIKFAASGRHRSKESRGRYKIVHNPKRVAPYTPGFEALLASDKSKRGRTRGRLKRQLESERRQHFGYAVEVYHQQKPITYIPVPGKNRSRTGWQGTGAIGIKPAYKDLPSKLTKIRHRGMAKASWGWMLRRLGRTGSAATKKVTHHAFKLSRKHVYAKLTKSDYQSKAELGNYLMYMTRAYPGIAEKALQAASRGLMYQVDKTIHRRVVRKLWG